MAHGSFATVINCIDGRVQIPVLEWMKENISVDYVDSITEPGPDKTLSEGSTHRIAWIKSSLLISVEGHHSRTVAVVGHFDCAANPGPKEMHLKQLKKCVEVLKEWNLPARILGLWVNENWEVEKVYDDQQG